jgi:hypothetical protein
MTEGGDIDAPARSHEPYGRLRAMTTRWTWLVPS